MLNGRRVFVNVISAAGTEETLDVEILHAFTTEADESWKHVAEEIGERVGQHHQHTGPEEPVTR